MRLRAAAVLGGLVFLAHAGAARASERLAVIFVAEGQPEVADSLTEIAIARLAEQRGDLVGLREVRGRLPAAVDGEAIEACLARGACLNQLREAAGAERAVIGRLTRAPEGGWRLDLGLADATAAKVAWLDPRTLPLETDLLYAGVRAAIDELIPPQRPPPAPPPIAPAVTAPAARVDLSKRPEPQPPGIRVSRVVVVALTGLAAVAFATAAVRGSEGSGTPTGSTRAEIQADLRRREALATDANLLLAAGGVLTVAAAGVFVWRW